MSTVYSGKVDSIFVPSTTLISTLNKFSLPDRFSRNFVSVLNSSNSTQLPILYDLTALVFVARFLFPHSLVIWKKAHCGGLVHFLTGVCKEVSHAFLCHLILPQLHLPSTNLLPSLFPSSMALLACGPPVHIHHHQLHSRLSLVFFPF